MHKGSLWISCFVVARSYEIPWDSQKFDFFIRQEFWPGCLVPKCCDLWMELRFAEQNMAKSEAKRWSDGAAVWYCRDLSSNFWIHYRVERHQNHPNIQPRRIKDDPGSTCINGRDGRDGGSPQSCYLYCPDPNRADPTQPPQWYHVLHVLCRHCTHKVVHHSMKSKWKNAKSTAATMMTTATTTTTSTATTTKNNNKKATIKPTQHHRHWRQHQH